MTDEEYENVADAILDVIEEPIVKLLRRVEAVERTLSDFEKRLSAVEAKSAKGAAR